MCWSYLVKVNKHNGFFQVEIGCYIVAVKRSHFAFIGDDLRWLVVVVAASSGY